MARKFVSNYSFSASSKTVNIAGYVPEQKLLMITHIPTGTVIQQFADPLNGYASRSYSSTSTVLDTYDGVTTFVLDNACTGMSDSDILQIVIEEDMITTRPFPFGTDAIERTRVSNPESLIDADFEYGLQGTKWQTFASLNNIPGIYELPGQDIAASNVYTSNASPYSTITVISSTAHGLSNGSAITITGLENNPPTAARAEGAFLITTSNTTAFSYLAKGYVGPNTNYVLFTQATTIRKAGFYGAASIPFTGITATTANPSLMIVSTSTPHGLVPGHNLTTDITITGNNTNYAEGNFVVASIPTSNSFTFTALTGANVGLGLTNANMIVYSRTDSFNIHRPFDGGVLIGPDSVAHGAQVLRQSKKYFRYQSGKGLLWTSGTLYHPNYDIESASSSGTTVGSTITIQTEQNHGLQSGATVVVSGVDTAGYSNTYTVGTIVSDQTFTVSALTALGSTTGSLSSQPRIAVSNWHGSSIRAGMFDDQNGLFWESDGQRIYAVKRSSTFQLAGTMGISNNSTSVTGTSSRFAEQLRSGDRIVIRGQSRLVTMVANNTQMYVSPAIRIVGATTIDGVKGVLTIDNRVPQEDFNRDRIDGTGPSGYNFNLNKMQMTGVQYSWYGAGFADFIIRGLNGDFVYAHRFKNNNVNDEAYMRSGNLPARYEIINDTQRTYLSAAANATQTFLQVADTYSFPSSGTLFIDNEMVSYTAKTTNSIGQFFTSCGRSASLSQYSAGSNRTFTAGSAATHANNAGIQLYSVTCSPTLSHWGSSVIMDGGFDDDRGYFFNFAKTGFSVAGASTGTSFLIRLAPTVSNSLPGDIGIRELMNRSQILLEKIEIISNQNALVTGILNPANTSSVVWTNLNTSAYGSQPSFAQISTSFTGVAAPGEQILSTIVSAAGGLTSVDLSSLKELGNAVNGGTAQYPDGPDVLAINIQNLAPVTAATVQVNLFWSETQA
jgi:hypothetical protein